jgi:hypothetical protein
VEKIFGDWYTEKKQIHLGCMFLNHQAMYEVERKEDVLMPKVQEKSWDSAKSLFQWCTWQEEGHTCFQANFQGRDPNQECVEITVRRFCFYPKETGISYITLSGFTICESNPQWAPPTAHQEGMAGPHWSKGWIIEDCEIFGSRCAGISLGKYLQENNENKWRREFYKDGTQTERETVCQAQREGWSKERIGSHIIRRCRIHDCGQAGIVGHLGAVFSEINENEIYDICTMGDLNGCEIAGIKLHAAIDVIIRKNYIHHCARGIWLDWQAQGTRVTGNIFHHNTPPAGGILFDSGEDIFVEVSHGPTLIDHNIMLTENALRISSQGVAVVHNLITGFVVGIGYGTDNGGGKLPTPRYTPYYVPHRTEIAGFMTILHGDARFYNNVFVQREITEKDRQNALLMKQITGVDIPMCCGTKPYDGYPTADVYFSRFNESTYDDYMGKDIYYDHLPVYMGGNIYFNGALSCDSDYKSIEKKDCQVEMELRRTENGYELYTDLYRWMEKPETGVITSEMLGTAFEPEARFENPDGTDIVMNQDLLENERSSKPVPGPLEKTVQGTIPIFPGFEIKLKIEKETKQC